MVVVAVQGASIFKKFDPLSIHAYVSKHVHP